MAGRSFRYFVARRTPGLCPCWSVRSSNSASLPSRLEPRLSSPSRSRSRRSSTLWSVCAARPSESIEHGLDQAHQFGGRDAILADEGKRRRGEGVDLPTPPGDDDDGNLSAVVDG